MDKVFIKDLHVQGILGINEWERNTPQDILINITLYTITRSKSQDDDLNGCIDYSDLSTRISNMVKTACRYTIEALAEDIASLCLKSDKVQKVIIKVEKPDAITGASSAGVEIERK